jgi:hypothetical protein
MTKQTSIPKDTIDHLLASLGNVDAASIEKLRSLIADSGGFELSDPAAAELSKFTQLNLDECRELAVVLGHLYRGLNDDSGGEIDAASVDDLVSGLEHLPHHKSAYKRVCDNLATLLKPISVIEDAKHRIRIKRGFLKNTVEFASFVDARPRFNLLRTEILELIPVVQFRIVTDGNDGVDSKIVFQLDEAGIEAMQNALDTVKIKMDVLKRVIAIKPQTSKN